MRTEQTVSELVVEVVTRQAEELAARTGKSFHEAYGEVLETEAGRQLAELAEGPHRHETARFWQANLLFERAKARAAHSVRAR